MFKNLKSRIESEIGQPLKCLKPPPLKVILEESEPESWQKRQSYFTPVKKDNKVRNLNKRLREIKLIGQLRRIKMDGGGDGHGLRQVYDKSEFGFLESSAGESSVVSKNLMEFIESQSSTCPESNDEEESDEIEKNKIISQKFQKSKELELIAELRAKNRALFDENECLKFKLASSNEDLSRIFSQNRQLADEVEELKYNANIWQVNDYKKVKCERIALLDKVREIESVKSQLLDQINDLKSDLDQMAQENSTLRAERLQMEVERILPEQNFKSEIQARRNCSNCIKISQNLSNISKIKKLSEMFKPLLNDLNECLDFEFEEFATFEENFDDLFGNEEQQDEDLESEPEVNHGQVGEISFEFETNDIYETNKQFYNLTFAELEQESDDEFKDIPSSTEDDEFNDIQ